MSLLLGLITCLINHPKVRANETFWWSECSPLHMLPAMKSVVGEKMEKLAKGDLASEITCTLIWIQQISLKHGSEDCRTTILSFLHKVQGRFESTFSYFIQQLLMHMEKSPFGGKSPTNLKSRLEQTQKLIWHSSLKNPDEEHHEYQTFWWRTQQHSDVHPGNTTTFWCSECSPRFSSKSLWGPGHVA